MKSPSNNMRIFKAIILLCAIAYGVCTIPPAPTAALGKLGDTPVGYYTGMPNIQVPLHTIQYADLTLPFALDYHAGGIRIEEMASWVGLGRSLSAGGVIARTVHGVCDEIGNGYPGYGQNVATILSNIANNASNEQIQTEQFNCH